MQTPQIKVSNCCKEKTFYRTRGVYLGDGKYTPYLCSKCRNGCQQIEVCEWCLGAGEYPTDETDDQGHVMRGVDTQKCPCQTPDDDGEERD